MTGMFGIFRKKEKGETEMPAGIIMYGTTWCYATKRARSILEKHNIPFKWIDIDKDADGRKYVESVNNGYRSVPTILFPDGSILVEPSDQQLEEKLTEG